MWSRFVFIWITLLCFISSCDNVEALRVGAEGSVNLGGSGLIPSLSANVRGSVDLDADFGLENFNLVEGDIIPDEADSGDRSATVKKSKLWPSGRIPYVISSKLSDQKSAIKSSMRYIENVTCLRFVKRTVESNYIRIFKGKGCNSKVGMSGGMQNVSLGPGCYKQGKIMHELLHAAGFYHEQSRSDRDSYIAIHWDNIQEGHEKNFVKNRPDQERLLTPYDYNSLMHYSAYSFSKDKARGLKTMTAKKQGVVLKSPGDKVLSRSDIKRVSMLYNCTLQRLPQKLQFYRRPYSPPKLTQFSRPRLPRFSHPPRLPQFSRPPRLPQFSQPPRLPQFSRPNLPQFSRLRQLTGLPSLSSLFSSFG